MSNFFEKASNTKPYLKATFFGMAGSGKTHTSALLAIGIHKEIKSTKPIIFFDTEEASKFLIPLFEKAGIELLVKRSRTLADLLETMRIMRTESPSDILIIDSLSHIWEDTVEAFKKKYNRTNLQFQDWGILKPTWKTQFADPYVRDPYHVIVCGRAGYEYENELNEQTGKREIYKSGVKIKAEGETSYESDLLLYMEQIEDILGKKKVVYRTATVLKDRSTLIDGKVIKNPTYESFKPVVDELLRNPNRVKTEETDSSGMFRTEEDKRDYTRQRDIALENIEAELLKAWPSTGAQDKKAKVETIEKVFGSASWTFVQSRPLDVLESGLEGIKKIVKERLEN